MPILIPRPVRYKMKRRKTHAVPTSASKRWRRRVIRHLNERHGLLGSTDNPWQLHRQVHVRAGTPWHPVQPVLRESAA